MHKAASVVTGRQPPAEEYVQDQFRCNSSTQFIETGV